MTQPAHSKLGASSYYRWGKSQGGCAGSVKMCVGLVSPESVHAALGTHAHGFAAQELEMDFFGKKPDAWIAADDDMREAVKVYTDFVKEEYRCANMHPGAKIFIEHRFDLSTIHPGMFGTSDAIIYNAGLKKLVVADYKHGAGIAVDVEDNAQLMYYGLGALLSTNLPCAIVELVIVQPRCDHPDGQVRRWTFQTTELLDFMADLADDAKATEDPNAELKPGGHCRFCPAAATKCPAIKQKAQALAKLEFKPELTYDPDKLQQALVFLPALEAWIKQVREFAYGEAMHGRTPPGWKLVEKRATRKWKVAEDVIVAYMKDATKKDESEFFEEPSLKSPAQMEKLCNKQIGEGLRELMESVSSGYNLVPESDKRAPAKLDAKSEFTQIEAGE
jgi:hypothetical protein